MGVVSRSRSALWLAVALAGLVLAPAAAAAGTRTINFDDVTAPCNFGLTAPLTTQYQAQGVTFAGPQAGEGGAILNECGGFGVTGHSVPNFLAFNTTGYAKPPETVTFATPAYSVAIKAGTNTSAVGTLTAFDGTTVVAESTLAETSAMQVMTVRATRITSVQLLFSGNTLTVFDDLVWGSAPVSAADTYQTTRGKSLSAPAPGLLANDSDPNTDPLTAVLIRGASNGTVVLSANGAFGYIPKAGFTGTDTFDYVASDGGGMSSEATVTINVVAPVQCIVPKVVGLRIAAARTKIGRANCAVGKTRLKRSTRPGRVLSQSPRPGTRLARASKVNLVVGRR